MNELVKGVQYFVLAVLTLAACPRHNIGHWSVEDLRIAWQPLRPEELRFRIILDHHNLQ